MEKLSGIHLLRGLRMGCSTLEKNQQASSPSSSLLIHLLSKNKRKQSKRQQKLEMPNFSKDFKKMPLSL
jgi:hypothetical protein